MARLKQIFLFSILLSFAPFAGTRAEETDLRASVYVFVDTICPIANAYIPELNRIAAEFEPAGITFRLVYPAKGITEEQMEAHLAEYESTIQGVLDPDHARVRKAGATTTPEVAVFDADETLCYRGRIDNLYSDLGDRRRVASETYLRDVLQRIRNGRTVSFHKTEPVGCLIEPLD